MPKSCVWGKANVRSQEVVGVTLDMWGIDVSIYVIPNVNAVVMVCVII